MPRRLTVAQLPPSSQLLSPVSTRCLFVCMPACLPILVSPSSRHLIRLIFYASRAPLSNTPFASLFPYLFAFFPPFLPSIISSPPTNLHFVLSSFSSLRPFFLSFFFSRAPFFSHSFFVCSLTILLPSQFSVYPLLFRTVFTPLVTVEFAPSNSALPTNFFSPFHFLH